VSTPRLFLFEKKGVKGKDSQIITCQLGILWFLAKARVQ
jgi:hypothetical protein